MSTGMLVWISCGSHPHASNWWVPRVITQIANPRVFHFTVKQSHVALKLFTRLNVSHHSHSFKLHRTPSNSHEKRRTGAIGPSPLSARLQACVVEPDCTDRHTPHDVIGPYKSSLEIHDKYTRQREPGRKSAATWPAASPSPGLRGGFTVRRLLFLPPGYLLQKPLAQVCRPRASNRYTCVATANYPTDSEKISMAPGKG
ncbi:uncharacterized protein [Triticum aestivum]|uniref:uncharacterized protein n=1 Tax=Triticum aestivum TaxID=4565 RepID=UPI001D035D3B|nr:uncharacterized protein LOC123113224 [Triticum aestivum]